MNGSFLLLSGADENYWHQILVEALAPLGSLDVHPIEYMGSLLDLERYDVIILDASISHEPSEFVARLRAEYPLARIVVVTTSPTWRRARDVFQAGAVEYIQKSVSPTELRLTFEHILEPSPTIYSPDHSTHGGLMHKGTILFADNNLDFLKTRKEFLEHEGYQVITAVNPVEARSVLESGQIDLAILDIRLRDDDDQKDLSGINLAKDVARTIPKIIMTNYPSYEYARETLMPDDFNLRPAVNFIAKEEGPDALVRAVKKAIAMRNVFVVHGHDMAARETVARFVERLGLRAILLQEQSNAGRTVIEKFEDSANVAFAIVLLTPDDVGASQKAVTNLKPRARQNVIFELGYFIAKLGRQKVCALYKEGVELPSDYEGVLYLSMDAGEAWKSLLAREMKSGGLNIDLNKVL